LNEETAGRCVEGVPTGGESAAGLLRREARRVRIWRGVAAGNQVVAEESLEAGRMVRAAYCALIRSLLGTTTSASTV